MTRDHHWVILALRELTNSLRERATSIYLLCSVCYCPNIVMRVICSTRCCDSCCSSSETVIDGCACFFFSRTTDSAIIGQKTDEVNIPDFFSKWIMLPCLPGGGGCRCPPGSSRKTGFCPGTQASRSVLSRMQMNQFFKRGMVMPGLPFPSRPASPPDYVFRKKCVFCSEEIMRH
jgi:hypothetical protein